MDLRGAYIRNIYTMCQDDASGKKADLRVNIPHYQRPYKWGKEQIEHLFSDYMKNKQTSSEQSEYFLGSVVTVKKLDKEYHDIIDGQQRVTTVFLLNYLKFLILRVYIEELLMSGKSDNKVSTSIENLEKTYNGLLGKNNGILLKDLKRNLEMLYDALGDVSSEEEEESVRNKMLTIYQLAMKLPDLSWDTEDERNQYVDEYVKGMHEFLEDEALALRYSRNAYNDKLKKAMANVWIELSDKSGPKLHICNKALLEQDEIIYQYNNVMKYEFEELNKYIEPTNKSLKKCESMINIIDSMLDNLQFCVIITGKDRDAYTLFEVLNDRSLQLSDLDLVKNLFFRKYCDNPTDSDSKKDKVIERLDTIWGDDVFSNISETQKILIAYLTTVYFTASDSIRAEKTQGYREVLEKNYLDEKDKYNSMDIERDFRIFQMVRILTDKLQFKYSGRESRAFSANCTPTKSITYRTLHLLYGLKQEGVMPAVVNVIIHDYIQKQTGKFDWGNDIKDKFNAYLDALFDIQSESKDEFSFINKIAYKIWINSLISSGAEYPRSYAKSIVEMINDKKADADNLKIDIIHEDDSLIEQFESWTDEWRYGKTQENLKVKILFYELLNTDKQFDKIIYKPLRRHFLDASIVQLDHLEADKPDEVNIQRYFLPKDKNDDRKNYTNALGNFMLLDNENNNNKNNKPLDSALSYYDNMGQHWLIDEIKELLLNDAYCEISTDNHRKPKEEFFNERKKRLQSYFKAVLLKPSYKDKTVLIK